MILSLHLEIKVGYVSKADMSETQWQYEERLSVPRKLRARSEEHGLSNVVSTTLSAAR